MLTTSLPRSLDNGAGLGGLITAMLFIGMGAGIMKATFFPFLGMNLARYLNCCLLLTQCEGDQYVQKKPQLMRRKNGEMVIVDGALTLQLMYNVYYWFTNVASLSSIPSTFLEKEIDFWASYSLTTGSIWVSIILMVLCAARLGESTPKQECFPFPCSKNSIVKVVPQGNVLPKALRVMACAVKSGFRLDNAKPAHQESQFNRKVAWSYDFVEEMKRGLLACRIM